MNSFTCAGVSPAWDRTTRASDSSKQPLRGTGFLPNLDVGGLPLERPASVTDAPIDLLAGDHTPAASNSCRRFLRSTVKGTSNRGTAVPRSGNAVLGCQLLCWRKAWS